MPRTLAEKLRIRENFRLLTLHKPVDFEKGLLPLPAGVSVIEKGSNYDQVHWFVKNRAQLEKELNRVMKLLKPDIPVWVYYPKGSSGMQTDLTRDKGWDCLLAEGEKLAWISLLSFDHTWSIFGFRAKTEKDIKKALSPKPAREIFNWVNPATKEIKLPEDMAKMLKGSKKAGIFFQHLSFTNKKEYIEWIITAKRKETRKERLQATLDKLLKGWKNPRNL